MPRLSPDGLHVLSGVGAEPGSRVRIDRQVPPGMESLIAGSWDWSSNGAIVGNGSGDQKNFALWSYDRETWSLAVANALGATATYGGGGNFVAYLGRTGNPVSYDKAGTQWPDRVARGMSPHGTPIFTAHENDVIYYDKTELHGVFVESIDIRDYDTFLWADGKRLLAYAGANPLPSPVCPMSGGKGARFAYERPFNQAPKARICQWERDRQALVIYPWQTAGPLYGYVLNTGNKDFNHDIACRDDGTWVVATGVNAAETEITIYEIRGDTMSVNGGPWQVMESVRLDEPAYPPIVKIGRNCWFSWYIFSETSAPRNCNMVVGPDMAVRAMDGRLIAWYVSAAEDSNVDQLEHAIEVMKAKHPGDHVLAYWTRKAQAVRAPRGADFVLVEAYWQAGETIDAYEAAVRSAVAQCVRPWLDPQCYTSNTALSSELRAIPPVIARIAKDQPHIEGIVCFSAGTRPTGYEDHPEVHADWQSVFDGITGPGHIPDPVPPEPIPPNPIPPTPDHAFSYGKELSMNDYPGIYGVRYGTENGFLFGRVVPGTIDIVFDQTGPNPNGRCEVTKIDETHYVIRFVDADRIITFLGTPDIAVNGRSRHFETRPSDAIGPSESPDIIKYESDNLIFAAVRYLTPDGQWAMSSGLTLVKWA